MHFENVTLPRELSLLDKSIEVCAFFDQMNNFNLTQNLRVKASTFCWTTIHVSISTGL